MIEEVWDLNRWARWRSWCERTAPPAFVSMAAMIGFKPRNASTSAKPSLDEIEAMLRAASGVSHG